VDALTHADKNVSYACIESENGHDAFLLPIPRYLEIFSAYMDRVAADIPASNSGESA
ncbi:MAG: homoserine O-acetyltransferase, partial [Pseudomonadota bacterium]